jgi:hypothetical protein
VGKTTAGEALEVWGWDLSIQATWAHEKTGHRSSRQVWGGGTSCSSRGWHRATTNLIQPSLSVGELLHTTSRNLAICFSIEAR